MHRLMLGAAGVALGALVLLIAGCGKSSDSPAQDPASTDTAYSEVAIGVAAGAAGSDDTSANVALRSRPTWQWIADLIAFERAAYGAAGSDCGAGGTWVPTTAGMSRTYMPPDCTITYGNGTSTTLSWIGGPWNLVFVGCLSANGSTGLVGSGCPVNSTVTWSAPGGASPSPITRSWTGPLGHAYVVTNDSGSGAASGFSTQIASAGTVIACTPSCPIGFNSSIGIRTIQVNGTHITGTLDGNLNWDHTVYSPAGLELNITGSGADRVIASGTIVVEHNLAQVTTTTVFNGPLTHMAGCAFPIGGSVTTAIAGGSDDGLTETVTFSETCAQATVTHPDGSEQTLYLSLVL